MTMKPPAKKRKNTRDERFRARAEAAAKLLSSAIHDLTGYTPHFEPESGSFTSGVSMSVHTAEVIGQLLDNHKTS